MNIWQISGFVWGAVPCLVIVFGAGMFIQKQQSQIEEIEDRIKEIERSHNGNERAKTKPKNDEVWNMHPSWGFKKYTNDHYKQ